MAWRRIGEKPLSEPMLARFTGAYAALGRNGLTLMINWKGIATDGLLKHQAIFIYDADKIFIVLDQFLNN